MQNRWLFTKIIDNLTNWKILLKIQYLLHIRYLLIYLMILILLLIFNLY
jgi:hypothetical protein